MFQKTGGIDNIKSSYVISQDTQRKQVTGI